MSLALVCQSYLGGEGVELETDVVVGELRGDSEDVEMGAGFHGVLYHLIVAENVYFAPFPLDAQSLFLGQGEADFLGFVYLETEAEVAVAAGGGGDFGDR